MFPEATMIRFGRDLRAAAEPLDGPFCHGLPSTRPAGTGVALVAGVFEPAPDGRVYNTAFACDANGEPVAAYRKIHLYDALGQRESELVAPGGEPVIVPPGRAPGRPADLLRRPVPRAVPGPGRGRRGPSRAARRVGAGAVQGRALGHAGPRPGDREHDLGSRRRAGARPGRPVDHGVPTGVGRSMLVDPMGTVRMDLGPGPGVAAAGSTRR